MGPRALTPRRHIPEIDLVSSSRSSSSATPSSTSTRIRRSFQNILHGSLPVVSIFKSSRDEIHTITQAARLNGLHTGVMRRPRREGTEIKEEGTITRLTRRYSWWVLMGRDVNAVEELMSMHERDIIASKSDPRPQPQMAPEVTMAHPPVIKLEGPSMMRMIFCYFVGSVGGILVCFIFLSIL